MKNILLLFTLLIISFSPLAQKQSNNWYFGANAGVTFNTTPPTAITNGQLSTSEGCATISDAQGNLLFYTDGSTVWDRNHNVMPNGTGLSGNSSSAQSAVIVPKPGDPTKYYIVTVPAGTNLPMSYSVVDMSLNSGSGDVLMANKNTTIFTHCSEKVTIVKHANDLYYWIIGRKRGMPQGTQYIATLIDCQGVDIANQVVSDVGLFDAQSYGAIAASPNGQWLATACSSNGIELAQFNNVTGAVSNPIDLGTLNYSGRSGGNYGVSFSPNSQVLYASSITNWALAQWDLSAANIPASETFIGYLYGGSAARPSYNGGALQLASDGKIYVAQVYSPWLGVINNPNVVGTGCNLQNQAIDLQGRDCRLGLPPFIMSFFTDSASIGFSGNCEGYASNFTIQGVNYIDSAHWDFGVTTSTQDTSTLLAPSFTYPSGGNYNVRLIRYLDCVADTSYLTINILSTETSSQTKIMCNGGSITLPDGVVVSSTGIYTSTISTAITGCDSVITTTVVLPQIQYDAGDNQEICFGDSAQLNLTHNGNALSYQWSPAASLSSDSIINPIAKPTTTTTYTVTTKMMLSNNLVVNGDFENGNTDFSSQYVSSIPNPLGDPGHYTISTTITNSWWSNCPDHTTGTGNMMIVDGANGNNGVAPQSNLWCQTIKVQPNTDYAFYTWITNSNDSGSTSQLGFFINGMQIGNTKPTLPNACQWDRFYVVWNSGSDTTASICIAEMSGDQPGNDFAIDDIGFFKICEYTDSVTVTVNPLPKATITEDASVCQFDESPVVTFQGSDGTAPYEFTYTSNDGSSTQTNTITSDNNGTATFTVPTNTAGTSIYTLVSVEDNSSTNCSSTQTGSVHITVNPLPDVSFSATPIEGAFPLLVDFTNTSTGATNYHWTFGDGFNFQNNNQSLSHTYQNEGIYQVILEGTSDEGCVDTAQAIITVLYPNMQYRFPNVFTPNGDAANDYFHLIQPLNVEEVQIVVLNRWGNVVYESDELNFSWNGSIMNTGNKCDDGTYFYKATLTNVVGDTQEEHGFVQLNRGK